MGLFGPTFTIIDNALAVGAHSATVYGRAISLKGKSNFAIAVQIADSSVQNLQIQMEQSFQAPTTENAADAWYVVPNGATDIVDGLAATTLYIKSISPVAFEYLRLKIITKAGHTAGSITSWLGFLEDYDK